MTTTITLRLQDLTKQITQQELKDMLHFIKMFGTQEIQLIQEVVASCPQHMPHRQSLIQSVAYRKYRLSCLFPDDPLFQKQRKKKQESKQQTYSFLSFNRLLSFFKPKPVDLPSQLEGNRQQQKKPIAQLPCQSQLFLSEQDSSQNNGNSQKVKKV